MKKLKRRGDNPKFWFKGSDIEIFLIRMPAEETPTHHIYELKADGHDAGKLTESKDDGGIELKNRRRTWAFPDRKTFSWFVTGCRYEYFECMAYIRRTPTGSKQYERQTNDLAQAA